MDMLKEPLRKSAEQNARELAEAEHRLAKFGDPAGNRHQRRKAARSERKAARATA